MDQTRNKARIRRDGWTVERQLGFLAELARTRSVTKAARAVGMSRESAYRLRSRSGNALLAGLWDSAVGLVCDEVESHGRPLSDGRLARLLGNHFRRKSGDFCAVGRSAQPHRAGNRT